MDGKRFYKTAYVPKFVAQKFDVKEAALKILATDSELSELSEVSDQEGLDLRLEEETDQEQDPEPEPDPYGKSCFLFHDRNILHKKCH